jgi:putative DNA primase/helicase
VNFREFASVNGLIIDRLYQDGRWHRVPTLDKPRKRNGAYLFDGNRGVVKNWATMEGFASWREDGVTRANVGERQIRDMEEAQREKDRKYAQAAQKASLMLSNAEMASHHYLAKKGFPKASGLVLDGSLLIPMRDYKTKEIISLQMIAENGEKKFLPGGRAKGAVFVIGQKPNAERWLVEGFATGLSVMEALRGMYREAEVWVCFSAGNLQYIAERIGGKRFVVADHDKSCTGERVAKATGLPWGMPPEEGEDANDLHKNKGIWNLISLLREIAAQQTVSI